MVTSNHVYVDELTVHGEHDVKTGIQQVMMYMYEKVSQVRLSVSSLSRLSFILSTTENAVCKSLHCGSWYTYDEL
jgi:hypothetical protein